MAININYTVPVETAGNIAYQGGRGVFLQEQDKYNEGVRQFDTRLAQNESQFSRNLNYQQELAMLRDRQRQEELAQQSYQFDRRLGAASYEGEANRRNRLQALGLGEQFQQAREGRLDTRRIEAEGRADKRQLTRDQKLRVQKEQDRQFEVQLSDAKLLQKQFPNLSEEQRQQAIDQFEQRTGMQFPFTPTPELQASQEAVGQAKTDFIAKLGGTVEEGGFYTEGLESLFIDQETGEHYLEPPDEMQALLGLREKEQGRRAAAQKVEDDNASKERIANDAADRALEKAVKAAEEKQRIETKKASEAVAKRLQSVWDAEYDRKLGIANAPDKEGNASRKFTPEQAKESADKALADYIKSAPGLSSTERNMSPEEAASKGDGERVFINGRGGTIKIIDGKRFVDWD